MNFSLNSVANNAGLFIRRLENLDPQHLLIRFKIPQREKAIKLQSVPIYILEGTSIQLINRVMGNMPRNLRNFRELIFPDMKILIRKKTWNNRAKMDDINASIRYLSKIKNKQSIDPPKKHGGSEKVSGRKSEIGNNRAFHHSTRNPLRYERTPRDPVYPESAEIIHLGEKRKPDFTEERISSNVIRRRAVGQ